MYSHEVEKSNRPCVTTIPSSKLSLLDVTVLPFAKTQTS